MDDHLGVHRGLEDGSVVLQPLPERLALEKLGDDVGSALKGADVMNGQDVRMIERSNRPRLVLETTQTVRITCKLGRKHLDRHITSEPRVAGAVDLTHAP